MKKQTQIIEQNDLDLSQYGWEELLAYREKLNAQKEEAEAGLSVINTELLAKLKEEKINGKVVGDFSISKATRITYDISLPEAEQYGAVKRSVDQTILKQLAKSGVEIPNEKRTEYVLVKEVNKSE